MTGKERFGYDPLAWLREEGVEEQVADTASAADEQVAVSVSVSVDVDGDAGASPDAEACGILELPEVLHISEVGSLKERLQSLLDNGQRVIIDGGSVERVDGASLQLLCAFASAARAQSAPVEWRSVSDAFAEAVDTLGLRQELFDG